ncbi:MAG: S8 family serine peptidase [Pseudomonadota bacterium]
MLLRLVLSSSCLCVGLFSYADLEPRFDDRPGGDSPQKYFVQLEQPSVAEYVIRERARTQRAPGRLAQIAQTRRVHREQTQMSRALAPLVTREIGRLDTALNGLKVLATPSQVVALRKHEGVKQVSRIAHHQIDNAASVAWVGAPEVWDALGDGDGIKIAIIDTGIDYLHANFGGAGDPDEYAANDLNTIEAGSFPTAKVIGGWDFAGPTYNSRVDDVPMPDPDPLDGNGHGSHVAGTAAGVGVERRIGPGVAKGAQLMALKVFSDASGSTDLTADAIDYALDPNGDGAIDDRVDVINMSLGARYGSQSDPSALASTVAVQAGVIVVASAGNNGDEPYVTGSPGVSPDVITVGATISGARPQIALRVLSDDADLAGLMPAQQGSGAVRVVDAPVTAPLIVARSPAVDSDNQVIDGEFDDAACRALTNADAVRGKVVLVARGGCSYETKYAYAQRAGAMAILAYNNGASNLPFIMGGIGLSGKTFTIPGMMISGTDAGRLRTALENATAFTVQFDVANTVDGPSDSNDQLTFFTSRGPATGGAQFKPDLSAPGRFIVSTAAGTGFQARQLRGTSMAAPHVAGAAALMRQRYPDLPPAHIKALLQNATVTSELEGPGTDTPAPLTRQGLGVMRIPAALSLTSYAMPAGVSFGYALVDKDATAARSITVVNRTDQARVFTGTHIGRAARPGLEVTCPDTVTVPANDAAIAELSLSVSAAALLADPGQLEHSDIDGWCLLSDGIDTLRIGYIAARDSASSVEIVSANESMTVVNAGPARGRASAFELAGVTSTGDATRTIGALGYRRSTILGVPVLQLALALNEGWETPAHVSVEMRIDAGGDGLFERILWAGDWSLLRFDPGTYVTGVFKPDDEQRPAFGTGYTDWFTEDIDFNDQVMMLPFSLLPQFGLSFIKPPDTSFDYQLRVYSRDGTFAEQIGTIDFGSSAPDSLPDLLLNGGESVTLAAPQSDTLLWLMPGNRIGDQFAVSRTTGTSRTPSARIEEKAH